MLGWIKRQARKYQSFKYADMPSRRECVRMARDAYVMRNVMMAD